MIISVIRMIIKDEDQQSLEQIWNAVPNNRIHARMRVDIALLV